MLAPSVVVADATQLLVGENGQSSRWGSGWLVLDSPTDFKRGDKILLTVGGTAKNIKIRFLPKGRSPETTAGMLSGVFPVPDNRIVEIKLSSNRLKVTQISVHGGPNPWGKYPLGGENGPATIESAELVKP